VADQVAGGEAHSANEFRLHVLKRAAVYLVLGLLGIDLLISWAGSALMAGTAFLAVFLYVLPLSLAVAAVVWAGTASENWIVTLAVAAGALFLSVALQNVLPGARHVVPVNPTCHSSPAFFSTQSSQICTINSGFSPLGGVWYVVTVLYGYVQVYGVGVVVAAVATGIGLPVAIGVTADLKEEHRPPAPTG
jgi:hypothetical protein